MTTSTLTNQHIDSRDDFGWSRLHHAAKDDKLFEVKRLLVAGAIVNAKTTEFRSFVGVDIYARSTPLHIAASCGRVAVVQCLLENGAEIDAVQGSRYVLVSLFIT